jgi:hypothetical protein
MWKRKASGAFSRGRGRSSKRSFGKTVKGSRGAVPLVVQGFRPRMPGSGPG